MQKKASFCPSTIAVSMISWVIIFLNSIRHCLSFYQTITFQLNIPVIYLFCYKNPNTNFCSSQKYYQVEQELSCSSHFLDDRSFWFDIPIPFLFFTINTIGCQFTCWVKQPGRFVVQLVKSLGQYTPAKIKQPMKINLLGNARLLFSWVRIKRLR